jgi:hypothetical protein
MRWIAASVVAASAWLLATGAPAQVIDVQRVERPPVIDGVLDDLVWQRAPDIARLTQVEPIEGAEPTERTELWIARDDEAIYVAIHAYDRDPSALLAKQMPQDVFQSSDDRINLLFDPFGTEQQGYFFQINPLGTRREALSGGTTDFRDAWDTIWYGDARIDDSGWTCELRIPFQSLSLDPDSDVWGFEIERVIRRRNEKNRWANISQNHFVAEPGNIGTLRGMRGVDGRGIDFKPTLVGTYERDRIKSDSDRLGHPGIDIFWRPTSRLTAALTLNTDFSDAPVDDRQTNLTRFPLFFPETRDFFLRDASIFGFGDLNGNGMPFFSRNIGIVNDRTVNLDGGLKLTGRAGRFEFGALHTQMGHESGVDAQRLTVARVRANILEESRVGVIFTEGDPTGEQSNNLVGADLSLRTSRFRGDEIVFADFWFQRTQSSGTSGREAAFGAKLSYPNDRINSSLGFTEIQENFNPRLGFTNRVGIRQYDADFRYRTRPAGAIRRIDHQVTTRLVTDRDNEMRSRIITLHLIEIANQLEDRIRLTYILNEERPLSGFFVHPDAFIPAGEHSFDQMQITLESAGSRAVSGKLEFTWGDFYTGRLQKTLAVLELRPSEYFFAAFEWEQSDGRLPEQLVSIEGVPVRVPGDFTLRLLRARINVNFSTKLSWVSVLQYDNLSDTMGLNSRLRWEIEPGREVSFVVNQNWDAGPDTIAPTKMELTAKVAWTFRY